MEGLLCIGRPGMHELMRHVGGMQATLGMDDVVALMSQAGITDDYEVDKGDIIGLFSGVFVEVISAISVRRNGDRG